MAGLSGLSSVVDRLATKWGVTYAEAFEKINSSKGKNDIASYVEQLGRDQLSGEELKEIGKSVQERIAPGSTLMEKVKAAPQVTGAQPQLPGAVPQVTEAIPTAQPAQAAQALPQPTQAVPVGQPTRLALPEAPKGEVVPSSKTSYTPRAPSASYGNPELVERIRGRNLKADDLNLIRRNATNKNEFIDVVAEDISDSPAIVAATERFKALPPASATAEQSGNREALAIKQLQEKEFTGLVDAVSSAVSNKEISKDQGSSFLKRIKAGLGITAGLGALGAATAVVSGKKEEPKQIPEALGKPDKVESAVPEMAANVDSRIRSAIVKSGRVKQPEDIGVLMEKLNAIAPELSADRKQFYEAQRDRLSSQLDDIRKEQKQALADAKSESEKREATLRNLELAETLGHALVQLGAGMQGLATNTNLSGLKFNKNDWQREYDRSLRGLEEDRKLIQGTYAGVAEDTNKRLAEVEKGQEKEMTLAEKKSNDMRDFLTRDYLQRQSAYNAHLENQDRFNKDLQIAQMKGDAKAVGSIEKESKKEQDVMARKLEKEAKSLEEAHAVALNLTNGTIPRKDREKAFETFKKHLRNAGVDADKADGLIKQAGEDSWFGYNYKRLTDYTAATLENTHNQLNEIRDGSGRPFTPPQKNGKVAKSATGGKVKMIPPGGGPARWVPEADVKAALAEGATRAD